ncbi:MAG TPA: hypothetical protein VFK35_03215 [Candidatus Limnocylindrales bacterium]|nr:hypothetical protein [Candidatus Limnocylindrales bacterium]
MYAWIVLLHVVGAFLFVLSHGVAAWMALAIRGERDRARIGAMLSLSSLSMGGVYLGLLMLLIGGVWAGIAGGHFGRGWIWASLGILVIVITVMYLVATPFFVRLRGAVGVPARGSEPDPTLLATDEELAALVARAPVIPIAAVGGGGLLLILWLMVLKPF